MNAMCILMPDMAERSAQLVSEIYPRASLVIIWLGEEEKTSSSAMKVLRDFAGASITFNVQSHQTEYMQC